jgi:hypothetical protein
LNGLINLTWKRAKDIFKGKDFSLYETIDIGDIHQGQLGNCYFLSAISALAEFPERFKQIFQAKEKDGFYAVQMYIQGKPKVIVLDDSFPVFKSGTFCFSYSGASELWVQVLEKAWSKINGSYAMTIAGLPSEAFSALTEAPTINYTHKKYDKNMDELWKIILSCNQDNFTMCTSCGSSTGMLKLYDAGLVSGHAYTLISAKEYPKDKSIRLI